MTNINEDDNGDCDYYDDWGGQGGWDDQDHRHCNQCCHQAAALQDSRKKN